MSDIVKMPTEIISAEIKTDSKNLITAFGQACSYKLFSHKSYIVVPKDSGQEDLSGLCLLYTSMLEKLPFVMGEYVSKK